MLENQPNTQEIPAGRDAVRGGGGAVGAACVGVAAGVVLRVVQMLYRFDYASGFYTDGGFLAWVGLAAVVAAGAVGCLLCLAARKSFGAYVFRKNTALGAFAMLSGALLIASGFLQAADYVRYLRTGVSSYDAAERGAIHVAFFALCFLFGLVQIAAGVSFLRGRDLPRRLPLLYLAGVLWGVAYLLLVYIFYAKSTSFVENFFAVAGGACLLLSLFYLCEVFAGVTPERAARRLFPYGIFAVVLNVTYSFSNLALLALGKSYVGEINPMIQLSCLGVALFLLVFLMTFRGLPARGGGHRFKEQGAPGEK